MVNVEKIKEAGNHSFISPLRFPQNPDLQYKQRSDGIV